MHGGRRKQKVCPPYVTHPAVSVSFHLRHAAPASPLTTIPCLASATSISFSTPNPLSLSISLPAFLYLHLTLTTQAFVHTMSIRDVRFGPAPGEAQTEPQRGHRERHQRRSYWMSGLR